MDKKHSKPSGTKQSGRAPHPRSDEERYDATEPDRVRRLEEEEQEPPRDEDEFVTDAELEAREVDRAEER